MWLDFDKQWTQKGIQVIYLGGQNVTETWEVSD